jgi:hypothetical protein
VYSSKKTGSPELARLAVPLPTRSTQRLPGWNPGVIWEFAGIVERHETKMKKVFVFTVLSPLIPKPYRAKPEMGSRKMQYPKFLYAQA